MEAPEAGTQWRREIGWARSRLYPSKEQAQKRGGQGVMGELRYLVIPAFSLIRSKRRDHLLSPFLLPALNQVTRQASKNLMAGRAWLC